MSSENTSPTADSLSLPVGGESASREARDRLGDELTPEFREGFRRELLQLVELFLKLERSVYLEGLGILSVDKSERIFRRRSSTGEELVREICLTPNFEKCRDLSLLPRNGAGDIVEYRELAQRLMPRLSYEHLDPALRPSEIQAHCQQWLRSYFRDIREEVIAKGYSQALDIIGTLYALGNRQGATLEDRFTGADIFLEPTARWHLKTLERIATETLILEDPSEPFRAQYTFELSFPLNVSRELPLLGFEPSDSEVIPPIPIDIFLCEEDGKFTYHFVSNGFRHISRTPRVEVVFSLQSSSTLAPTTLEQLASPILTLSWLLLQGSSGRTLRPGQGLSIDGDLFASAALDLPRGIKPASFQSMLVVPFNSLSGAQRTHDGSFEYRALLALSPYEARLVEKGLWRHVVALLKRRGHDQSNKISRPCLGRKAAFGQQEELENASDVGPVTTEAKS